MHLSKYTSAALLAFSLSLSPSLLAGHGEGHSEAHHKCCDHSGGPKLCMHKKADWKRKANKLGLSDSQHEQFGEIMRTQHEKRQQIFDESGIRESLDALHADTIKQLSEILDEEQLEKFQRRHDKKCTQHHKSGRLENKLKED